MKELILIMTISIFCLKAWAQGTDKANPQRIVVVQTPAGAEQTVQINGRTGFVEKAVPGSTNDDTSPSKPVKSGTVEKAVNPNVQPDNSIAPAKKGVIEVAQPH
jgi:hypothetical protein